MSTMGYPLAADTGSLTSEHTTEQDQTGDNKTGTGSLCRPDVQLWRNFHITLTAITTILIFFGNLLLVVVISRTKKLRTPQGYMLLSIALADFIVGVESLLGFLTMLKDQWPTNSAGCAIMGYATSVSVAVTMYTLALMSVDRWVAIQWPFRYCTIMNRKRALVGIILMWILGFLVYVPYFFKQIDFTYVCETHVCILDLKNSHGNVLLTMSLIRVPSLTVIILCTMHTCRTAHLHAKQIHSLEKELQSNKSNSLSDYEPTVSNKHIKTTFIIIGAFILTWLPLYFLQLTSTFDPDLDIPQEVMFAATWLIISNSYVNWIICIVTDATFREGVKTLIKDICCCLSKQCQTYPDKVVTADDSDEEDEVGV